MGLGAGHVMDMINRMKQNRSQRPSNRSKFKENNREGIYSSEHFNKHPSFKTVPEKELVEIKKRINDHAKSKQRNEQVIFWILLIVLLSVLFWVLKKAS